MPAALALTPPVPDTGAEILELADPLLTGNLYCSGRLDEVYRQVLLPLRHQLRSRALDGRCFSWTIRYSRGGDHLKLRLHAPAADEGVLRRLVDEIAAAFLDSLGPPDPDVPRVQRADVPAIDLEDEAADSHADRTFIWTTYRRSHVSLGPPPFLEQAPYAARLTACLAQGLELLLDRLEGSGSDSLTTPARQSLLIKGLISGIAGLPAQEREAAAAYLTYHRGWLLRFFLEDAESETRVLEHFDQQADRQLALVAQLAKGVAAQWTPQAAVLSAASTPPWPRSIANLVRWLEPLSGDPAYQVDPFAARVWFAPLFKVFHGTANQIGLKPLEEAFSHHLLLRALDSGCPEAGRS